MLETHNIAELVVKRLKGNTTPAEIKQLDEWASLCTGNWIWLQRFYDKEWLESRVKIYREPDLDVNFKRVCARIDVRRIKKQRTRSRVIKLVKLSAAAVIIGVTGLIIYYSVKPQKTLTVLNNNSKTHQTASGNNAQAPKNDFRSGETLHTNNEEIGNNSGYEILPASSDDQKEKQPDHYLSIPRTGYMHEPLPDGSWFWLNSLSSIHFPNVFGSKSRTVEVAGEACFEVKPDKLKPFRVIVNGVQVVTFEGSFNISAQEEEGMMKITALKGKLRIMNTNMSIDSGQCAVLEKGKPIQVKPADIEKASAWTTKTFIFRNDSAAFVARELARWYGLSVKNEGRRPQGLISYTGSRQGEIADVISDIMKHNNVVFEVQKKDLVIR